MATGKSDKRTALVRTAARLAYQQGFRKTSLAEIAEAAQVPLGNVYYYFKTKDEIVEAVVEKRLDDFRVLREKWDHEKGPRERLLAFVQMAFENREQLARGGCPMGTLCNELYKQGGELADKGKALLNEPLAWLSVQFRALGNSPKESDGLGLHLLSALQGVSLLAHGSRDPELVAKETERLKQWILAI